LGKIPDIFVGNKKFEQKGSVGGLKEKNTKQGDPKKKKHQKRCTRNARVEKHEKRLKGGGNQDTVWQGGSADLETEGKLPGKGGKWVDHPRNLIRNKSGEETRGQGR